MIKELELPFLIKVSDYHFIDDFEELLQNLFNDTDIKAEEIGGEVSEELLEEMQEKLDCIYLGYCYSKKDGPPVITKKNWKEMRAIWAFENF